jgi:protocatechuate 3,4-dioxygenase alpha subunit
VSSDRGDRPSLVATASQTVGPFFHFGLTAEGQGHAVQPDPGAAPMQLVVRVTDGEQRPIDDAVIEIWISTGPGACAFARLPTGSDGACTFETVRPVAGAHGPDGRQAAHVNVCVLGRGLLRQLYTRVYFSGDAAIDADPVLGRVPLERQPTLLAHRDPARDDRWLFDLRLQGTDETVFFDV